MATLLLSRWGGALPAGALALLLARAAPGASADPIPAQPAPGSSATTVTVEKSSDRDTVVTGTFAVPRAVLFETITQPAHLKEWLRADGMTLEDAQVDGRPGGGFRYVFRRASGRRIEVRGAYRRFEAPRGFAYLETYDFSPLQIEVTTTLAESGATTRLTQTLSYASTRDRDEDFTPVSTSSREAFTRLGRYLAVRTP